MKLGILIIIFPLAVLAKNCVLQTSLDVYDGDGRREPASCQHESELYCDGNRRTLEAPTVPVNSVENGESRFIKAISEYQSRIVAAEKVKLIQCTSSRDQFRYSVTRAGFTLRYTCMFAD